VASSCPTNTLPSPTATPRLVWPQQIAINTKTNRIYVVNTHGKILRTLHAHQSTSSPWQWVTHLWLKPGQLAAVPKGAVTDSYGETNKKTLVY